MRYNIGKPQFMWRVVFRTLLIKRTELVEARTAQEAMDIIKTKYPNANIHSAEMV